MKTNKRYLRPLLATGLFLGSSFSVSYAAPQTLIVAGGCFWCVESDFEALDGVTEAISGYTGGHTDNPTYQQVAGKSTGHFEAVEIHYDDEKVTLETLVDYYWKTIDPTDANGQFCDKGSPYKTALFYQNDEQQAVFEKSRQELEQNKPFKGAIATQILPAKTFYPAEDFHQNYYQTHSLKYKFYRSSCGRDSKIKSLWGEVVSKHS